MPDQSETPQSIAASDERLPPAICGLHRAVLRGFRDSAQVHRDDLHPTAAALGVDLDDALHQLGSADLVHTAPDGQIDIVYPFSRRPTGHSVQAGAPHVTARPLRTPSTPSPSTLVNPSTVISSPISALAALATACAMGCRDAFSNATARRSSSPRSCPLDATTSIRVICPVVTVPFLPSTTVSILRVFSRT